MPIPVITSQATPGSKNKAMKNSEPDTLLSQKPKQLQFIDKIQEETAIDGGQSISTNPSIDASINNDLIVMNPYASNNPF